MSETCLCHRRVHRYALGLCAAWQNNDDFTSIEHNIASLPGIFGSHLSLQSSESVWCMAQGFSRSDCSECSKQATNQAPRTSIRVKVKGYGEAAAHSFHCGFRESWRSRQGRGETTPKSWRVFAQLTSVLLQFRNGAFKISLSQADFRSRKVLYERFQSFCHG